MKGIILAGGSGTRLYPLTMVTSKQLLPIYDKPMIYYPMSVLMNAGIRDILIISTPQDTPRFQELLGDGHQFGVNLSYAVQPSPDGLAQAFIIGEEFIGDEPCAMILGDNIFNRNLKNDVLEFDSYGNGAKIFLKSVEDPSRFGVATGYRKMSMANNQLLVEKIEEKPKNPSSNLAVTGIYFYDSSVFQKIKTIKPSARGELEITDVNNLYIKDNQMTAIIMDESEWWTDAGTLESLQRANKLVHDLK